MPAAEKQKEDKTGQRKKGRAERKSGLDFKKKVTFDSKTRNKTTQF